MTFILPGIIDCFFEVNLSIGIIVQIKYEVSFCHLEKVSRKSGLKANTAKKAVYMFIKNMLIKVHNCN